MLADALGPEVAFKVHPHAEGFDDLHVWHRDRPDDYYVVIVKEAWDNEVGLIGPNRDFIDSVAETIDYLREQLLSMPTAEITRDLPPVSRLREWWNSRRDSV